MASEAVSRFIQGCIVHTSCLHSVVHRGKTWGRQQNERLFPLSPAFYVRTAIQPASRKKEDTPLPKETDDIFSTSLWLEWQVHFRLTLCGESVSNQSVELTADVLETITVHKILFNPYRPNWWNCILDTAWKYYSYFYWLCWLCVRAWSSSPPKVYQ